MTTNHNFSVTCDYINRHGKIFLLLLITSTLLLSCSFSDKKALISKTESVIEALVSADYSRFPELEKGMENIDEKSAELIYQNMNKAGSWNIKVNYIEGFSAMTTASASIEERDYKLVFTYTYDGKSWQLDDEISFQSEVDFIPFIGRE